MSSVHRIPRYVASRPAADLYSCRLLPTSVPKRALPLPDHSQTLSTCLVTELSDQVSNNAPTFMMLVLLSNEDIYSKSLASVAS